MQVPPTSLRFDPVSYVLSGIFHEVIAASCTALFALVVDTSTIHGSGVSLRAFTFILNNIRAGMPLTSAWGYNCTGIARCGWMVDRRAGFVAHLSLAEPSVSVGLGQRIAAASTGPGEGTLRLYRWRWLPPMVSQAMLDGSQSRCTLESIDVVRACKTGHTVLHAVEPACPSSCPTAVASAAMATALKALWEADASGPMCGVRVIISGPPGCGKSMSARVAARMLKGMLVVEYRPDCKGSMTMIDIMARTCPTAERPVVIVWNEFDQCVRKYRYHSRGRDTMEIATKADHCDTMDYLQFQPHVMLVMTTNLSVLSLRVLDSKHDCALFRTGRVTALFRMNRDGSHVLTDVPGIGDLGDPGGTEDADSCVSYGDVPRRGRVLRRVLGCVGCIGGATAAVVAVVARG